MPRNLVGFFAPWLIYLGLLGLHLVVPARRVDGYVTNPETGEPLRYRLNGLPVMLLSVGIWAILGRLEIVPYDWLYLNRWAGLAGAATLGLLASLLIVGAAPKVRKSFLADFFFGRRVNPQFFGGRVDAKMFLYLVGATLLALNILSFTAHHVMQYGERYSASVILYAALFSWFLIDYMTFERVHLYTYDLFAERVGFKLTFGCFTFYPYFYAIGLWVVADLPAAGTPPLLMVLYAVVFFLGWSFARGANMQKFFFKTDPQRVFLGIFEPQTISDGTNSLLSSGFWSVSRHVNYLGEILMATGLTLALGYPLAGWAWRYPLYYLALLFTRERDDDKRCRAKYGPLWDEYVEQVPRRIVPGIY
jgi:Delta14-sterol reductase